MSLLSVIIPVFNEKNTIRELVQRVENVQFGESKKELVIIDDGSTDGTRAILEKEFASRHHVILHDKNRGKGAAIRTGINAARGNFFVIQDADLEYNPQDLISLLNVLLVNHYDVVYGSRVLGKKRKAYSSFLFHLGGEFITWWTNLLYGTRLTDEATCYKMFTRQVLNSIHLTCNGFEFCPEFTGKVLNAGYSIHEVPISYAPRSKKQGKKIKIQDGILAIWMLLKLRLTRAL